MTVESVKEPKVAWSKQLMAGRYALWIVKLENEDYWKLISYACNFAIEVIV